MPNKEGEVTFEAQFSSVSDPEDEIVLHKGKVFKLGDYPAHKFSLNAEEADKAIAEFKPVTADLEHLPTVLDGKLGRLTRVWRENDDIYAEAEVPAWFSKRAAAKTISLAFDRVSKAITGWGWVLRPGVKNAELVAAFNEAQGEPTSDQPTVTVTQLQGDLTDPKSWEPMAGAISQALQARGMLRTGATSVSSSVAAEPEREKEQTAPPSVVKEKRRMSLKDKILAAIQGIPDEELVEGTVTVATQEAQAPTVQAEQLATLQPARTAGVASAIVSAQPLPAAAFSAKDDPVVQAVEKETKKMREEIERLKRVNRENAAVAFADRLINDNQLLPAQRNLVVAMFSQLSLDDEHESATVTFSDATGKEYTGSRLETFQALLQASTPHTLTQDAGDAAAEESGKAEFKVVKGEEQKRAKTDDDLPDAAEIERLLGATNLGKTVLKDKKGVK